jgi:hypothetical protein
MSMVSRAVRSTELRITDVELDDQAKLLVADASNHTVRMIAWNPRNSSNMNCDEAGLELRRINGVAPDDLIFFFEVERGDTSDFTEQLHVQGRWEGSSRVLHARSAVVANSIAALLIYIERSTGCIPHVYFHWTDVNPVTNVIRYIFLGEGDAAPLTHEVLRRAIKDPSRRPVVHVS